MPLTYFSYLGGGGDDSGLAIAVLNGSNASTPLGDAEVTGTTNSTNFPVTIPGAIQTTLTGTQNAYLAQIDTNTTTGNNGVGSFVTYFGGNGMDRGTSLAVDTNQNTYMAGDTTSANFNGTGALTTVNALQDVYKRQLNTLHNFTGFDGEGPVGNLTFGPSGSRCV